MKAITLAKYGAPSVLQFSEVPVPRPSLNEVLIKVHSAGLNRADIVQRTGKYPPPHNVTDILGLECSGIIEHAVPPFYKGQQVMALLPGGGYAQYVTVHKGSVIPVPKGFSLQTAAALPEAWITAHQLLSYIARTTANDRVLVHAAASGVGTALVQLAKRKGAFVCGTTRSLWKQSKLNELGADMVCSVTELNDQFNVILDPIGGSVFELNVNLLKSDGKMVVYGVMGGAMAPSVSLGRLLVKRIQLHFTVLRSRTAEYKEQLVRSFIDEGVLRALETGEVSPVIDTIESWSSVQELHTRMESNTNLGKIIMKVD